MYITHIYIYMYITIAATHTDTFVSSSGSPTAVLRYSYVLYMPSKCHHSLSRYNIHKAAVATLQST